MSTFKRKIKYSVFTFLICQSFISFTQPLWRVSGAPLGDTSSYFYPTGGWGIGNELFLSSPLNSDSLHVFNVNGTPSGIHIYGVQKKPNAICGSNGIGGNNRYFGVFVIDGTLPNYSISYYYGGNPFYTSIVEPSLDLASRPTNADTACLAWSNTTAFLNTVVDSLMLAAQTGRKEYILTTTSLSPLPVSLQNFTAILNQKVVKLNWLTYSEINNDYFLIERSQDGIEWEYIDKVDGKDVSVSKNEYYSTDFTPREGVNYYRLKQVDIDGYYSYSTIEVVSIESPFSIKVFPSPSDDYCFVEIKSSQNQQIEMTLLTSLGKVVLVSQFETQTNTRVPLNVESFQNGLYFIHIVSSKGIDKVLKFIVQH